MKPSMFYDGACPLCRREVAHYRRLDRDHRVDWIDITEDPDSLIAHRIDYHKALARLHVIDEEGRVVTGVPAFLAVWRHLPGYRHLATAVQRFGVESILDRAYYRFAAWRLRKRCSAGSCQTRPEHSRRPRGAKMHS